MNIFEQKTILSFTLNLDVLPVNDLGNVCFDDIKSALIKLKLVPCVEECIILQKCNCVELYVVASKCGYDEITHNVASFWQKNARNFKKQYFHLITIRKNHSVIKHLFETACGLKSILYGDAQVLGQVENAYRTAQRMNTVGTYLRTVFIFAKNTDFTIKHETDFHKGYTSVERTAALMTHETVNDAEARIVIVGAGEIGSLIIKSLLELGHHNILLTNRTYSKAVQLAEKYKIQAEDYSQKFALLDHARAYIITTSDPNVIFTKKLVSQFRERSSPLLLVDISNPPKVSEDVKELQAIELINLDKIQSKVKETYDSRINEIKKCKQIIRNKVKESLSVIQKVINAQNIRENIYKATQRLKSKKQRALFVLRSKVFQYFRDFLLESNFIEVQTPKVVVIATDPVKNPKKELFQVNWFNKKAFLAQSAQLHKQALVISGLHKIFEIAPFWRAEEQLSPRHLCEAWSLDVEMAKIKSYREITRLLEAVIHYVFSRLKKEDGSLLKLLKIKIPGTKQSFYRITYNEALELLNKNGFVIKFGEDIGFHREKALCELIKRTKKVDLFFVEQYPDTVKKFYVKKLNGTKHLTCAFDLFYKGWELASGAQRETSMIKLREKLVANNLDPKKYTFYLSLFKGKVPEHGGFGMGLDRFVARLANVDDVRRIVLFPRDKNSIVP